MKKRYENKIALPVRSTLAISSSSRCWFETSTAKKKTAKNPCRMKIMVLFQTKLPFHKKIPRTVARTIDMATLIILWVDILI